MYFRFGSALVLVILLSVAGIAVEKRCLALRRAVMRQRYRREVLADDFARLRLRTQQLGAPIRLFDALESRRLNPAIADRPEDAEERRQARMASGRAPQAD